MTKRKTYLNQRFFWLLAAYTLSIICGSLGLAIYGTFYDGNIVWKLAGNFLAFTSFMVSGVLISEVGGAK